MSRPLVRVGVAHIAGIALPDDLELTCSECPEFGVDYEHKGRSTRNRLARQAHRHAEEVHDGDVDREGWT